MSISEAQFYKFHTQKSRAKLEELPEQEKPEISAQELKEAREHLDTNDHQMKVFQTMCDYFIVYDEMPEDKIRPLLDKYGLSDQYNFFANIGWRFAERKKACGIFISNIDFAGAWDVEDYDKRIFNEIYAFMPKGHFEVVEMPTSFHFIFYDKEDFLNAYYGGVYNWTKEELENEVVLGFKNRFNSLQIDVTAEYKHTHSHMNPN